MQVGPARFGVLEVQEDITGEEEVERENRIPMQDISNVRQERGNVDKNKAKVKVQSGAQMSG